MDGSLAGERDEGGLENPWGWGEHCLSLVGLGAGAGRSGRERWSWGLTVPCCRGRDAVGGLIASRTSGTGMRKLTTRSSLESDSELESSPLSRSR